MPRSLAHPLLRCTLAFLIGHASLRALETKEVDVRSYSSLQAAIDANPGRMIRIPEGEYEVSAPLRITAPNTGLYGPARILQQNVAEPILVIENTTGVRIENLTLARPAEAGEALAHGVMIVGSSDVELQRVRVSENHTHSSITVRTSRDVTVEACTVTNYKGITIDDRTGRKDLYGFAFRAINGTGIEFRETEGGIIRNNRIEEFTFLPTKAIHDRYGLGTLTIVPETPGRLMDEDIVATNYTNNWHQGAAIQISSPGASKRFLITGNYIENPAQGIDLHCDYAIIAHNMITNAMIGLKATHGAKHMLIDSNQFSRIDLWGLLLMPGALSHTYANQTESTAEKIENVDGGSIVSNNIFSQFGYGDQLWNWEKRPRKFYERNVIAILAGQLSENPAIHEILLVGNIVYDSGRDGVKVNGRWEVQPPRYFHALYVEPTKEPKPVNVKIGDNILHPGLEDESPPAKTSQHDAPRR